MAVIIDIQFIGWIFSLRRRWIRLISCWSCKLRRQPLGRLAQLVRALLSHGRGHRFESRVAHSPPLQALALWRMDRQKRGFLIRRGSALRVGASLTSRPLPGFFFRWRG